jgi:hypothetical protein
MQKEIFSLILTLSVFVSSTYSQSTENLVPVYSDQEKIIYINVTGLSAFQEDQIFVWVQEEMAKPFTMEEVDGMIFKVKSYFTISKSMKKYSLLDVIYYDEGGNVLKTYHYERRSEYPEFQYASPIIENSEMERVFVKCMDVINSTTQ